LVAPAHDILEDWALLEWLDEEFAKKKSDPDAFLLESGPTRHYGALIENGSKKSCSAPRRTATDWWWQSWPASNCLSKRVDDTLVAVLL